MAEDKTPEELAAEQAAKDKIADDAAAKKLKRDKALEEQGGLNRKQIEEINSALAAQLSSYQNINKVTDQYRAVVQNIAGNERELAKARGEGNLVLVAQLESIQETNKAEKKRLEGITGPKGIVPGLKDLSDELITNTEALSEQSEEIYKTQLALDRMTSSQYKTGLANQAFSTVWRKRK